MLREGDDRHAVFEAGLGGASWKIFSPWLTLDNRAEAINVEHA